MNGQFTAKTVRECCLNNEVQRLEESVYKLRKEHARQEEALNFLAKVARQSVTGVSIDFNYQDKTYRVMWKHTLCQPAHTLLEAIEVGMSKMCNDVL